MFAHHSHAQMLCNKNVSPFQSLFTDFILHETTQRNMKQKSSFEVFDVEHT